MWIRNHVGSLVPKFIVEWGLHHTGRQDGVKKVLWG